MFELVKKEEGNILVLTALALVVLLGFAALAIDVGVILTARTQLQDAVDAAALAGASGLLTSQTLATTRAIGVAGSNDCLNQPVALNAVDVTFPTSSRVQVQGRRLLNLFFARVLGVNTANLTATATAELSPLSGTPGLRPWAIPDLGWVLGQQAILKSGSLGAPATNPSFYYAVDYPPLNRGTPIPGANEYRDNIQNGCDGQVFIGDVLKVEPGNMVGPTQQGVNALIALDPTAYWNGTAVAGSIFPGFTSPRIVKIPFYDPNFPPLPGRKSITVIGFGAFFLEGMSGQDVVGRFMKITSQGSWGAGSSLVYGVRLVQ
jgi:Flp pilus assembly protein TadG